MQVQFGFRAKFLFQCFHKFISIERQKQVGHIFKADIVSAHVLKLFPELHKVFLCINGTGRITDCRFADAAVFLDRLHGSFKISRIVERVEHTNDAHTVFNGFFHELFDEIIGIMTIAKKILAS